MTGIANRMAYVLRPHEVDFRDSPILREVKCGVWWTLFMADQWCPPGLGLPREVRGFDQSLELPMDEAVFQGLDNASVVPSEARTAGLWQYKITLVDVLGPTQDLNLALVRSDISRREADEKLVDLGDRLRSWYATLPEHMKMNEYNLDSYRSQGQGGTFVALHLGYHHYSTLLYYQYLGAVSELHENSVQNADECKFHALSFSRLLHHARQKGDCEVVYLTVAHMTIVSSSVLVYMIFLGVEEEIEAARMQVVSNFEALVELTKYWPRIDKIIQRLLMFQDACLQSTTAKTHQMDRWMLRFLLEHALPLQNRPAASSDGSSAREPVENAGHHEVSFERTNILDQVFENLYNPQGTDSGMRSSVTNGY